MSQDSQGFESLGMHQRSVELTRELAQKKLRMEGKYLVGREEAWREHPDVAQRGPLG